MNEVEQFYLNTNKKQQSSSRGSSFGKERDKERHVPSIKKQQQDASRREAAAAKRMQELMRQFGTILRQVIPYSLLVNIRFQLPYAVTGILIRKLAALCLLPSTYLFGCWTALSLGCLQ